MSHTNKKGKTLTTKRKNKSAYTEKQNPKTISGNTSSLFDSFISVRSSKQKDVSLLSAYSSDSPTAQENETDFFKFPQNPSRSVGKNIFSETTILPHTSVLEEETKIDPSMNDSFSSSKSVDKFDNSSLFFERNSKSEDRLAVEECNTSSKGSIRDVSSDDIAIPDIMHDAQNPVPNSYTGVGSTDETEHSQSDLTNQCPVCLKIVVEAKYISHIKSCAAKNKLSTQQLLSAIRLHKKQLAERKELGLGNPLQSYKAKVSPKRSRGVEKKGPVDSSLQLALALSASLHSAQEDEVIQEAEALKEAGLSEEAERKLSTLEKYGFASALPVMPRTAAGSKSRPLPPSLLLRRTQEERERIVTEKVAIVLISEEESSNLNSFTPKDVALKSRILKDNLNDESQLWNKAQCPEGEEREVFYVKTLSQFVSPSKGEVGVGLRRLSQLPGRMNTPVKEENSDSTTPCKSVMEIEETDIDFPTPLQTESVDRGGNFDYVSQSNSSQHKFYTLSSLSEDWEQLVNNAVLSDTKIQCRDGIDIPAHKLVFHVRCPTILNEVVKQPNGESVLDWRQFSVNSVLAFLEFVYCGKSEKISMLDTNDSTEIKTIAGRLEYFELKRYLGEDKAVSVTKTPYAKKNLFRSQDTQNVRNSKMEDFSRSNSRLASDSSCSERVNENNSERKSSIPHSGTSENVSSGRESPDMFGDSITNDLEQQQEREDLDILVSLMGKPTQSRGETRKRNISVEDDVIVVDSPAGSTESEKLHRKRKASNTSLSGEEDISLLKKRCSDVTRNEVFENQEDEELFDLTQSSKSSLGENFEKDESQRKSLDIAESHMLPNSKGENEAFDLTQSSSSSGKESHESAKCEDKFNMISNEVDSDDSSGHLTQKNCDESIPNNRKTSCNTDEHSKNPLEGEYHNENFNINTPNKSKLGADPEKSIDISVSSNPNLSEYKINSSRFSSDCPVSGRISFPGKSPSDLSNRNECDSVFLADNNGQDFIDPVWEGFDDYYQYNCGENDTSWKTPMKKQNNKSLNCSLPTSSGLKEFKSKKSPSPNCTINDKLPRCLSQTLTSPVNQNLINMKNLSSSSKSPKVTPQKRITDSSPSSINYVSSNSKSPKLLRQNVLNDYSPAFKASYKQNYHNLSNDQSEVELISEKGSTESFVSHKVDCAKSRKNLTFQFEASSDSFNKTSENREENSPTNAVPRLSQKSHKNSSTSSPRKDSLAVMQRLLDDSFEVNGSLFDAAIDLEGDQNNGEIQVERSQTKCSSSKSSSSRQDSVVAGPSKRSKTSLDTPSPGIIVSDKVTPLPDYSGMKTPALKCSRKN